VKPEIDRRSFLKASAAAGLAASAATPASAQAKAHAKKHKKKSPHASEKPNILVIMVDQLRYPAWFPDQVQIDSWLPNLARLRRQATVFDNHYTASDMCVAARGTMLTGLYSQQTGCMLTSIFGTGGAGGTTLSPGFPTWGTMLREQGYETVWWGKWHLNETNSAEVAGGLEQYGFDGGTYPSPNGSPSQGFHDDPSIAEQFVSWMEGPKPSKPWCTTVSLINPHDIAWWWNGTLALQPQALNRIEYDFGSQPPNFESSDQLEANKPRLQLAYQQTFSVICGDIALEEVGGSAWNKMLKLYVWLQQQVDGQIGRVLDALYAQPKVAENTIVVFTADHGEYAGSHGLRGKGGSVYDEAIHVPLYIVDPRGVYSNAGPRQRTQFTSSVDIAPLMLTLAHGSSRWRSEERYSHIANRADIAAIAQNGQTAGRPWIAHVTDETTVEELSYSYSWVDEAPHHVAAVRTTSAKYADYSYWTPGTLNVEPGDQDLELYDYSTPAGRLELDNIAGSAPALLGEMSELLQSRVIPDELREPLPPRLQAAQDQGIENFYQVTNDPEP
jgi:arylsulfatase A-like enzyme